LNIQNKQQKINAQVKPERLEQPSSHIIQTKIINKRKRGRPKKDQDIKSYRKKQNETTNSKKMDNKATGNKN
jgi:hypothetical protein